MTRTTRKEEMLEVRSLKDRIDGQIGETIEAFV